MRETEAAEAQDQAGVSAGQRTAAMMPDEAELLALAERIAQVRFARDRTRIRAARTKQTAFRRESRALLATAKTVESTQAELETAREAVAAAAAEVCAAHASDEVDLVRRLLIVGFRSCMGLLRWPAFARFALEGEELGTVPLVDWGLGAMWYLRLRGTPGWLYPVGTFDTCADAQDACAEVSRHRGEIISLSNTYDSLAMYWDATWEGRLCLGAPPPPLGVAPLVHADRWLISDFLGEDAPSALVQILRRCAEAGLGGLRAELNRAAMKLYLLEHEVVDSLLPALHAAADVDLSQLLFELEEIEERARGLIWDGAVVPITAEAWSHGSSAESATLARPEIVFECAPVDRERYPCVLIERDGAEGCDLELLVEVRCAPTSFAYVPVVLLRRQPYGVTESCSSVQALRLLDGHGSVDQDAFADDGFGPVAVAQLYFSYPMQAESVGHMRAYPFFVTDAAIYACEDSAGLGVTSLDSLVDRFEDASVANRAPVDQTLNIGGTDDHEKISFSKILMFPRAAAGPEAADHPAVEKSRSVEDVMAEIAAKSHKPRRESRPITRCGRRWLHQQRLPSEGVEEELCFLAWLDAAKQGRPATAADLAKSSARLTASELVHILSMVAMDNSPFTGSDVLPLLLAKACSDPDTVATDPDTAVSERLAKWWADEATARAGQPGRWTALGPPDADWMRDLAVQLSLLDKDGNWISPLIERACRQAAKESEPLAWMREESPKIPILQPPPVRWTARGGLVGDDVEAATHRDADGHVVWRRWPCDDELVLKRLRDALGEGSVAGDNRLPRVGWEDEQRRVALLAQPVPRGASLDAWLARQAAPEAFGVLREACAFLIGLGTSLPDASPLDPQAVWLESGASPNKFKCLLLDSHLQRATEVDADESAVPAREVESRAAAIAKFLRVAADIVRAREGSEPLRVIADRIACGETPLTDLDLLLRNERQLLVADSKLPPDGWLRRAISAQKGDWMALLRHHGDELSLLAKVALNLNKLNEQMCRERYGKGWGLTHRAFREAHGVLGRADWERACRNLMAIRALGAHDKKADDRPGGYRVDEFLDDVRVLESIWHQTFEGLHAFISSLLRSGDSARATATPARASVPAGSAGRSTDEVMRRLERNFATTRQTPRRPGVTPPNTKGAGKRPTAP